MLKQPFYYSFANLFFPGSSINFRIPLHNRLIRKAIHEVKMKTVILIAIKGNLKPESIRTQIKKQGFRKQIYAQYISREIFPQKLIISVRIRPAFGKRRFNISINFVIRNTMLTDNRIFGMNVLLFGIISSKSQKL